MTVLLIIHHFAFIISGIPGLRGGLVSQNIFLCDMLRDGANTQVGKDATR